MKKAVILFWIAALSLFLTACGKNLISESATDHNGNNSLTADIVPGNSVKDSGIKDIVSHTGRFNLKMSGYKGELLISIKDGLFYGTIKFYNWGNGVPQPLINLKVTEDKIYFRRVITTKEDLVKYGGTAYFEQDFYGIFSEDKKTIKGYYRYIGTQDEWEAVKERSVMELK